MAKKSISPVTYHVGIQGIKLSADTEKRIETEIRRVVMQELATIDFQGDLEVSPVSKFPQLFGDRFPPIGGGHTAGIVIVDRSST
jgi:hypothetical protein